MARSMAMRAKMRYNKAGDKQSKQATSVKSPKGQSMLAAMTKGC